MSDGRVPRDRRRRHEDRHRGARGRRVRDVRAGADPDRHERRARGADARGDRAAAAPTRARSRSACRRSSRTRRAASATRSTCRCATCRCARCSPSAAACRCTWRTTRRAPRWPRRRTPARSCPRTSIMFTIGTGVGGGLVLNGKLYRGATSAAELGHTMIGLDLANGAPADPGNFPQPGSLETLASGRALDRLALESARAHPKSFLGRRLAKGDEITGHDAVEGAREGDVHCQHVVRVLGERLGIGIANAINTFDPDEVVIGGGVSLAGDLLLVPAERTARRHTVPGAGTRRGSGSRATGRRPACSARRPSPRRSGSTSGAGACAAWAAPERWRSPASTRATTSRSPSTASSATCTRSRSSGRTARSTGTAARPSTRRACSGRSSTRTAAASTRSARPGTTGRSKQLYFPDTNVLITRFFTPGGVGEVQDFMPVEAQPDLHRHRLLRRVVVVRGTMEFQIEVQPRFDYAREEHEVELHPHGVLFRAPSLTLALEGAIAKTMGGADRALERIGQGVRATFEVRRRRVADVRARAGAGGPHLPPVLGARDRRGVRGDRRLLAQVAGAVALPRALARDGAPLGAHAEAADLRADRRARRRADHVAPRAARRRAQLGLPLHVDPRRGVLPLRAAAARLHRGGGRLHGLADRPHARVEDRAVGAAADHVRDRRPVRAAGDRAPDAGRATATRRRCGSATPRPTSASSTSTAS